jgi:hypothetical protein
MKIIKDKISVDELEEMSKNMFDNLVKAVVDVDQNIMAVDGEMHSDLEGFLIEAGSSQENLWGINLYPEKFADDFVEFDSVINIRPRQNNRSRSVEDQKIQKKIIEIVDKLVTK